MELDDELCLCFHVTRRKVENYIRRTNPQRPSQISECLGAGTGCGWCRPFLRRLWQRAQPGPGTDPSGQPSTSVSVPINESVEPIDEGLSTVPGTWESSTSIPIQDASADPIETLTASDYALRRAAYRQEKDKK